MTTSHNTSSPLFLLLGRLFLFLPLGTDAWRMGLISVLATTAGTILIYFIVRRLLIVNPRAKVFAIVASMVYGSSALVISQSTIIETYALSTTLMLLAYYFSLRRKWIATAITIGLIWAVHTLFAWMIWIVLLIQHKEMRNAVLIFITLSFLAFYAYIPIVTTLNGDINMWGNTSLFGFLRNNLGVLWMLSGALSLWDLPKRVLDTMGIIGVSLGFGSMIVAWYYIKLRKIRNALLWLILLPAIYFAGNLAPQVYVYLLPSIAFGAIVVGIGLSKLHINWAYATALVAVGLLVFNANYFDIGRTLDPNLSAQKFYDEELPKIKDGEIYLGGGWTWAIVYLYNKEEGRNIVPICIDILPSEEYLDIMEAQGIKLVRTESTNQIDRQWEVALSIAQNNPDVWINKDTIPSQYECEVVPAKGNEWLLTRWLSQETNPEIAWKPSNPYDFITGAIEVSEWKFILRSTHNARFALACGTIGVFVYWLMLRAYDKRKKGVKNVPKTKA